MMMHQVGALLQERGYKIASSGRVEAIATPHCLTLSCIRQTDATQVKIKVLPNVPLPTPSHLPRCLSNFQHEHKIMKQCLEEVDGVVKIHERLSAANMEALVLEDFGGESVDEWLRREGPFVERLPEFMEFAIEVTKALSQVHAHNIVHKNIQVCVHFFFSTFATSLSLHTVHFIDQTLLVTNPAT